eukprot:m.128580 g.128580  ORF g.128580 m.128580 type:complete len:122 (-) comp13873_c1_seq4:1820-2185(-)
MCICFGMQRRVVEACVCFQSHFNDLSHAHLHSSKSLDYVNVSQFLIGTQIQSQAAALQDGSAEVAVAQFDIHGGDVIMFDYRTVHRGVANTSQKSRPLLYQVYSKSWFADVVNFGEESLFQ